MFTFVGETVLDPFLGSGTTSLAAMVTNRNSIGYEINKEFLPIIKEKLNSEKNTLFSDFELIIKEQVLDNIDWKTEIKKLPYIFSDPVSFDKKVDPNKLKFGSKISVADGKTGANRERYFTVKQILDTNLIKLSNDLVIRLIGVKPKPKKQAAAITFLTNKILRRQVFLKFDETKYDKNNNLMAYVYMKNKTFVNAHLLKHGFAEIDAEFSFKYEHKFKKLPQEDAIYENQT